MPRLATALACLGFIAAGACTRSPSPLAIVTLAPPPAPSGWAAIATTADQARLAALPDIWARARAAVPRRLRAKMRNEGALVDPAVALEMPALPPGPYHCRLIRFGGHVGFATFAPDICYVESRGENIAFTKQTGSILPGGWLHPDGATRQVFLGTLREAAATSAPAYGATPARNVAGVVERVSPFRWRLVLTRAGRGATLDMYGLVPVTPEVPGATPAVPAP